MFHDPCAVLDIGENKVVYRQSLLSVALLQSVRHSVNVYIAPTESLFA